MQNYGTKTGLKVTNKDVADFAGVKPSLIGVYVADCFDDSAGRHKLPSDQTLARIAERLGADYNDARARRYALLGRYNTEPAPTDVLTVLPGDTLSLYGPGGRKVVLTKELFKRLELESEFQDDGHQN